MAIVKHALVIHFLPVPPASGVRIHLPILTIVLTAIGALALAKVIA